jgi:hypothetical protein
MFRRHPQAGRTRIVLDSQIDEVADIHRRGPYRIRRRFAFRKKSEIK